MGQLLRATASSAAPARPLAIVAGDPTFGVAGCARRAGRPSLYLIPRRTIAPWVTAQDIAEQGRGDRLAGDRYAGRPPPAIDRQFPDLVAEVPRAFDRQVQGRLPLLRIGWGVIRPRAQAGGPAPVR